MLQGIYEMIMETQKKFKTCFWFWNRQYLQKIVCLSLYTWILNDQPESPVCPPNVSCLPIYTLSTNFSSNFFALSASFSNFCSQFYVTVHVWSFLKASKNNKLCFFLQCIFLKNVPETWLLKKPELSVSSSHSYPLQFSHYRGYLAKFSSLPWPAIPDLQHRSIGEWGWGGGEGGREGCYTWE